MPCLRYNTKKCPSCKPRRIDKAHRDFILDDGARAWSGRRLPPCCGIYYVAGNWANDLTVNSILFLNEYGSLNGAEKSLLAVLPFVVDAGLHVSVVAPVVGPFANEVQRRGAKFVPWNSDFAALSLVDKRKILAEILEKQKPTMVHANSLSMGRLSGPVLDEYGIPGTTHIRDIVRVSAAAACDLNKHRLIIAVSDATRRFHIEQGIDGKKIITLYNGVDLNEFFPREQTGFLHEEFAIPKNRPIIGCIGQIGPRKGQDILLEAVVSILVKYDAMLMIVGQRFSEKEESVQFERKLHDFINNSGLGSRVVFCGIRNDVSRIFSELTILVHAARQEPLGRVLLEASACGCPIVATDVGGTGEILTNCDRLIPSNDPFAIKQRIIELLESPDLRARLGTEARKQAEQKFSASVSATKFLRLLLDNGNIPPCRDTI